MKLFTVHEPPLTSGNQIDRALSLIFIKYGFSWGAFFFSPLYFIFKKQWFVPFIYFLALSFLLSCATYFKFDKDLTALCFICFYVLFSFEASSLQRYWLRLRGWREIGSVTGHNKDECERNYFHEMFGDRPSHTYLPS